jgi:hypothetical protein
MSDAFSQSDDDLFSYDPAKEEKSVPFDYFSNNSKSNHELYEKISKDIKNNSDSNFLAINGLKIKFSQAVLGSYNFWVDSSADVSYYKAASQILDQLTNGRFTDLYLFNTLESNIIRRIQIVSLLDSAFGDMAHESDSFKQFLAKLDIDTDQAYIPTYIGTLVRISQHILSKERSMYFCLSEKLGIDPNPIVNESSFSEQKIFDLAKSMDSSSDNIHNMALNNNFINNFSDSFIDKLNNITSTNISYEIRSI